MLIRKRNYFFLVLLVLLFSGCVNRTFVIPEQNNYQNLPAVMENDVHAVQLDKINTKLYQSVVYLRMNNFSTIDSDLYETYLLSAVNSFAFFKKVEGNDLVIYINTYPREPKLLNNKIWYEKLDPYSIKNLKDKYGNKNVLIMDFTLREETPKTGNITFSIPGKKIAFDVKIIDLKTGKILFYAQNKGMAIMGVDKTIVNPVLNRVKAWLEANAVASYY